MSDLLRRLTAVFMVFAVAGLYGFNLQTLDTYAAEQTTIEAGDFSVSYDSGLTEPPFSYADGVLTINGDVTVGMKDGADSTGQRIVVAEDSTVTLDGVEIEASGGPGIRIMPGVKATLELAEGSENKVTGAGNYAGVEVGWEKDNLAKLTISGSGTLNAAGGTNSAGIGGSYSNKDSSGKPISSYCGDIVIEEGVTINATGNDGGAGIGSAGNNRLNADGTSNTSSSYKMLTTKVGSGGEEPVIGSITINGGTIKAQGSNAAGIGGGNHVDSGKVTINGGEIEAAGASGIGCGTGSHTQTPGVEGTKGAGYFYSQIEINGGDVTAKAVGSDNWGGAGIGGGAYCDADIKITGGTIHAYGGECGSGHNSEHHGGAGIGGGYEAHSDIEITGGEVYAYVGKRSAAAAIGSGGTPNSNPDRGSDGRSTEDGVVHNTSTNVKITGGTIVADAREGRGGAGIGGGTSADKVSVTIEGGTIEAYGASSGESTKAGGAGIGGGLYGKDVQEEGMSRPDSDKYHVLTDVDVAITGGAVLAVGGWGASGIGSGAKNKIANSITIDADKADIEAYADGTKFAIDTRVLDDDGSTSSYDENREVTDGFILQGTFVHNYEGEGDDPDQSPEGLSPIVIGNDGTGEKKTLTNMPEGYRSYATDVSEAGTYTVYTDSEEIGEGGGRYFSELTTDEYDRDEAAEKGKLVQYTVEAGKISDNFYLYPVKSVVVEKKVSIMDDAEADGLNAEAVFGVCYKDSQGNTVFLEDKGKMWTQTIQIKNGVPQAKGYFVNLDDRKYDVREIISGADTDSPQGSRFGAYTLKKITTQHGELFGLDEGAKHGLRITTTDSGGSVTITVEALDRDESVSITLSLFADEKLVDDSSRKLDKDSNWTGVWKVPKTKDGKEIEYKLGDTSNNATIDANNWSDEITVINTYKKGDSDDPDDPDDPEVPDEPEPPVGPDGPDDPDDSVHGDKDPSDSSARTGDTTNILLLLTMMTGALLGMAGVGLNQMSGRNRTVRRRNQ